MRYMRLCVFERSREIILIESNDNRVRDLVPI